MHFLTYIDENCIEDTNGNIGEFSGISNNEIYDEIGSFLCSVLF